MAGIQKYVAAAFSARPSGMPVPPNWIGIAAFGLLGLLNPGFWLIGAGAELGYLLLMATSGRYRRFVRADSLHSPGPAVAARTVPEMLNQLRPDERERFKALQRRCRNILEHATSVSQGLATPTSSQTLNSLLWIYLNLLVSRRQIVTVLDGAGADGGREKAEGAISAKVQDLERRIADPQVDEMVKKSLTAQIDILRSRREVLQGGRAKLEFVDAELRRIEEQIELVREQILLLSDPTEISLRLDGIAQTMSQTNEWITDQQRVLGHVREIVDEPPRIVEAEREL